MTSSRHSRILTTHTGSLPRPDDLARMIISRDDGIDVPDFETRLRIAVDEIVQQQREAGVDIVSDSEQGRVSYVTYIRDPLAGFEGNPSEVPSSDPTLDNHPERGSGDGIA